MNRQEVTEKLTEVFRGVFDDDSMTINDAMTANDVEDWDSLAHLQLISETEDAFGIHFSLGEINNFANVGELISCIEKHLAE